MKRGWRDAGCGNSCATPHNIEGEASGLFAPHEVNTAVRVSMTTMIACVIVLALISRVSAQQWEWVMPFTVDVPGNVVTVRWAAGLDPMGKCEMDVASVPDTLMRFTLCSIVSRLVFRQYEPVLLTVTLPHPDGGGGLVDMPLYEGDDPGLVLYAARHLHGLDGNGAEAAASALLRHTGLEVLYSEAWAETRARHIVPLAAYHHASGSFYGSAPLRFSPEEVPLQTIAAPVASGEGKYAGEGITMAVTTCRRLGHFLATMRAVERQLGPLPNALLPRVIVVDDGSSPEDRQAMQSAFPQLEYVFKGVAPHAGGQYAVKGHAASMNLITHMVRSRYLFYLEDDWQALAAPHVTAPLAPYVDVPGTSVLERLLLAALGVLRQGATGPHQVLFNAQHHRTCALGEYEGCPTEQVGAGSWPNQVESTRTGTESADSFAVAVDGMPYSLHEYGIVPVGDAAAYEAAHDARHGASASPSALPLTEYARRFCHDFASWSGLSLNPGLWDLRAIRRLMHVDSLDVGGVETDTNTDTDTDSSPKSPMFDCEDGTFEKSWSIAAYAAGARMAYMHGLFFRHMGDVSAYTLNGAERPWDAHDHGHGHSHGQHEEF